jgi:hypothetical protein
MLIERTELPQGQFCGNFAGDRAQTFSKPVYVSYIGQGVVAMDTTSMPYPKVPSMQAEIASENSSRRALASPSQSFSA